MVTGYRLLLLAVLCEPVLLVSEECNDAYSTCCSVDLVSGRQIHGARYSNPGPFNMKEHVLITFMSNCSYTTAYAVDIITIQKLWYGQDIGWGGGILLIWTTQVLCASLFIDTKRDDFSNL